MLFHSIKKQYERSLTEDGSAYEFGALIWYKSDTRSVETVFRILNVVFSQTNGTLYHVAGLAATAAPSQPHSQED